VRILLDTAIIIWAITVPERLSKTARQTIEANGVVREISPLSLSEIAIKQTRGKLKLSRAEVWSGIADLEVRMLSFSVSHAYQLFELPLHHSDPFDRMIIAQALTEKIPIVTPDKQFRSYEGLEVIW
jgi:PIN domain nuclease of toxin-antitoxin system